MNIKLVHNKSSFNVDILNDTPSQYLYEVVHKIFRIPIDEIELKYEDIEIKNNSRLVVSVMGKVDPDTITGDETIIVSRKKNLSHILSNTNIRERLKLPLINLNNEQSKQFEKSKSKKKVNGGSIICQICNQKNSIFYCRVCNLFVCFECNVRFNEHKNHERINLEDGDSFLGCDVYREELINELNVIELGYQKSLEWMIDNEDRENFFQELSKLLEQIRSNSLTLSDTKTLYNLYQEIIDDFRIEIDKIPVPRHKEEIFEIYGNLNLKENELRNYIKFVNLQIIKTEYNKVLLICLDKVKRNLDKLSSEVKLKLSQCEDIKFCALEDIQIYLKESKLEKNQMEIENYLSKNYRDNNNHQKINSSVTLIKNNSNNNTNSLSTKNSTNNFNVYKFNNNNEKNAFNRNNNSLSEKETNKTIEKKNKAIKLKGGVIENQKKVIKKINIDNNNIKNYNNEKISNIKKDLSPIKLDNKNVFQTRDNEFFKKEEKSNIPKLNITAKKLKLKEPGFNITKDNNNNKGKNQENNNQKNELIRIIDNNENDLIKPTHDDKTLKSKQSSDSLYQALTSSEKKIVFNPPIGIKNNSYGKTILNKKKSVFENFS